MSEVHSDRREAGKNPYVPGARILRRADARVSYDNASATMRRHYPVSEFNDAGLFAVVTKTADTDVDRPWAPQAHPNVNLYMYVLSGAGTVHLGVGDPTFEQESYDYREGDLVIIPRGVPYAHTGEWEATFCHARTSVYGTVSGPNRFPHPVLTYGKPPRPTVAESNALAEPGTLEYIDPLGATALRHPGAFSPPARRPGLGELRPDLTVEVVDANDLYRTITPVDPQTEDESSRREGLKNPSVLGARVLRKSDAPAVYNAHSSNKKRGYPLTWSDDFAIFHRSTHASVGDEERPWASHAHPELEEMNYILEGSGTLTLGVGDETFEDESYDFVQGDVIITPRGVPHKFTGDFTFHVFHAKASVFGTVPGTSHYPHPSYVLEVTDRPTAEEQAEMHPVGTYQLMNSRETISVFKPNPIVSIRNKNMKMARHRPDLFDGVKD